MTGANVTRFFEGLQRRAALGLRPVTAPIILFLPLGILLGPSASGLLPAVALQHLQFVVSIGLATLGVFIGIAAGREGRPAFRLFAASGLEAAVTILIVSGAVLVLVRAWGLPLALPATVAALALGISASASAAPAAGHGEGQAWDVAARVADLDDVLPIVIGGAVVVLAGSGQPSPWRSAVLTAALGLGAGAIGWLLVERAHNPAERNVFVLGTLGLLGGAPAFLGLSPLLAGLAAGWFWVVAPGRCDLMMAGELRKVQHPLVVLLIITAGASLTFSRAGIWLLAPYVVFRVAGKLLGGWAASRVAPTAAPADLGAYLIPPGAIGIAYALNLAQVTSEAAPLVFAVCLGAIACELVALFVTPAQPTA